ncbi:nitrogenase component 1 [Enhygromyxa salina]|uniref:Nitrogenase component 1 type Oxidoreductase n=1 Tax=Enhygromyxa salina TaxID=215803 RepID=A0A2S9XN32_9BACT|nr:nitrogenase component 1 [Enhygromyxa salina]PRP94279.1 Nitrogenase component 1 type Oxidoreductase [Enhygromyxa salina]
MSGLFPELDAYERTASERDGSGEDPRWSAPTQALFDQLGGVAGEPGADAQSSRSSRSSTSGEPGHSDPGEGEGETSVYHQADVRLFRPGIAAGAESLARFEKAFGLVGKIRSLKRTEGNNLEFVAEIDDEGTLQRGVLTPPGERAWKQGKSFGLSYGGELNPVIARALLRFLARYDGVPLATILAQIIPDVEDEHMLVNDYPESVFYAFAPSSGWRRFFEGTELYRGACGQHLGNVAIIDHTDIECLFNQAPEDERIPSFFNSPRVESTDPVDGPVDGSRGEGPRRAQRLFTDISDIDVIKGADVLVDQALELLAELPDRPDSVVIQAGCLPEVTGDDIVASAARTHDKLRLPVFAVGQHNDVVGKSFGDMLAVHPISLDRELDPLGVAILGMPALAGRRELLGLLDRAGVKVLTQLLPDMGEDALEQLARASVLVGYPWDRYTVTIERLAARMAPARILSLRPPFGLAGTRQWLSSIGAAVDRRAEVEAEIDAMMTGVYGRWQLLRGRAQQLRVGFVIEHGNWRSALSIQRSLGVPMLELLSEMGFGVDVLAYCGERTSPPASERYDNIHVRWYRTVEELDVQLADDRVAAWYSELHYDRRLTRNGKNTFSMRQFSVGLLGALDSLEGMLRVANMSFYRSYSRYLGQPFLERGAARTPGEST